MMMICRRERVWLGELMEELNRKWVTLRKQIKTTIARLSDNILRTTTLSSSTVSLFFIGFRAHPMPLALTLMQNKTHIYYFYIFYAYSVNSEFNFIGKWVRWERDQNQIETKQNTVLSTLSHIYYYYFALLSRPALSP